MVRMSQGSPVFACLPVPRGPSCLLVPSMTSSMSVRTSSSRSPMPTMMPVLATLPCCLTRRRSSTERSNFALGRTAGYMRFTHSMLWLMMCGLASMTSWSACQSPWKSGMSTSMDMPGHESSDFRIVSAQTAAPPSGSSSRLTLVTTTCLRFMSASDSATRLGSSRSSVAGLPVLTLQNPQARVHVSPRIMIVATPLAQHSPMFGQPASWQTVWSLWSSTMDLSLW